MFRGTEGAFHSTRVSFYIVSSILGGGGGGGRGKFPPLRPGHLPKEGVRLLPPPSTLSNRGWGRGLVHATAYLKRQGGVGSHHHHLFCTREGEVPTTNTYLEGEGGGCSAA